MIWELNSTGYFSMLDIAFKLIESLKENPAIMRGFLFNSKKASDPKLALFNLIPLVIFC